MAACVAAVMGLVVSGCSIEGVKEFFVGSDASAAQDNPVVPEPSAPVPSAQAAPEPILTPTVLPPVTYGENSKLEQRTTDGAVEMPEGVRQALSHFSVSLRPPNQGGLNYGYLAAGSFGLACMVVISELNGPGEEGILYTIESQFGQDVGYQDRQVSSGVEEDVAWLRTQWNTAACNAG